MGKLTIANLKKTLYYLKRNGLRNTLNAARERLGETAEYQVRILSAQELEAQSKLMAEKTAAWEKAGKLVPCFSILVPAYRTKPEFLRDLVASVKAQTYPNWELLILDASEDDGVEKALGETCKAEGIALTETAGKAEVDIEASAETEGKKPWEAGVRYVRLPKNAGISENTNAGIPFVKGNYVGLLDHDDVLTPDALAEMALAICEGVEAAGNASMPLVVYSDEDKWDGANQYYECNRKEDFNLDLLLSNNYVCHFMVMERELFCRLRLRKEYDGAQDYDLILRAVGEALARRKASGEEPAEVIRHVAKVLYHWRCHGGSTAENPQSKLYAYEAGKRALSDFAAAQGWNAKAEDLKHVGFYRLRFKAPILQERTELGAVGGKILSVSKGNAVVAGGRMAEDGSVYYEGLKAEFSGYLHRAVLTQDAEAVDIRCIAVSKEYRELFESIVGVPYVTRRAKLGDTEGATGQPGGEAGITEIFDAGTLPKNADVKALSLAFCKALRQQGKVIMWDPEMVFTTKTKK